MRVARESAVQFKSGGKTTGLPSLAQAVGDEVVKRLRQWFGGEQLSRIEETNTRFAALSIGSNRVVAEFDENGSILETWKFEEFRKLLKAVGHWPSVELMTASGRPIESIRDVPKGADGGIDVVIRIVTDTEHGALVIAGKIRRMIVQQAY